MTDMVHGPPRLQPGDPIVPRWWRDVDRWTITASLLLFATGMLLCLATTTTLAEHNGTDILHYFKRQAVFGTAALAIAVLMSFCSSRQIRRAGIIGFAAAFIALALLPLLGTDFGKGSTRWYSLGVSAFQPSEFLKPFFVVLTAWLMVSTLETRNRAGTLMSFMVAAVVVGMLALQPDFGQAFLIMATWGVMYFLSGAPIFILAILAALVAGAGFFAYSSSEHVQRRIDGFLADEIGATDQIGLATQAFKKGGVLGVGVGEGEIKSILPDAHTDFIIAAGAEEYGLVLALSVAALFVVILLRSVGRLIRSNDRFANLAGAGLVTVFATQAFVNLGVAVRLLPAKGMTLPFVSYGGSSLLATGVTVGMILALTRMRPPQRPPARMAAVFARGLHGR